MDTTYKNRDPFTRNFAPKRFDRLPAQTCSQRQAWQLDFEFDFLYTDAVKTLKFEIHYYFKRVNPELRAHPNGLEVTLALRRINELNA
jgi:hypothetical protein